MFKRTKNWRSAISKLGLSVLVLTFLLAVLFAGSVEAGTAGTKTYSSKLNNPIKAKDLGEVIGTITGGFMGAIGAFAVAAIVYGGVIYISSAGNEENIKKGKSIITYAVIGLGLALLAYVIVSFVIEFLMGG